MLLRGGCRFSSKTCIARCASTTADPAKYNSFGSPRDGKAKEIVRPVSPHVTIYKMPLPAVTSIIHRATGSGMVVGAILLPNYSDTLFWLFLLIAPSRL